MARSIRIPGLVDIKKVDDKAEILTLSRDTRLDRGFAPLGPLINRVLMSRIRSTLQVDGKPFPAIAPRGDAERAKTQAALRQRLEPAGGKPLWDDATLARLVAAVRGESGDDEIGPAAQQAVGRLFVSDYVGDAESWSAAKDLDDGVRSRNPLRTLQLKLTGRLRRSRALLAERARGDLACVHGTGIAVHNLARGFTTMRDLWSKRPHASAEKAVATCLYAPETVVRQATTKGGTLAGDVRPGTLMLFQLDSARQHSPGAEAVFMAGTWAECPAIAFVPALLRAVWERALAVEAQEKRA